jgi:protein-S-isoprenylcysteine O-methyltransferase Ste14
MRKNRRNIGIPLVIAAGWLAHLNPDQALISVLLVFSGEMLRIWAAGHLRKEQILTTGGPYRFIRNPLYLGSFFIAIGFCLITGSIWIWVLTIGYFLLCYIPVIHYEEKILAEKFPEDFYPYKAAVPAFFPTIKLYQEKTTNFSYKQVIKNKEYNAVLGILLVYAFLILLR